MIELCNFRLHDKSLQLETKEEALSKKDELIEELRRKKHGVESELVLSRFLNYILGSNETNLLSDSEIRKSRI